MITPQITRSGLDGPSRTIILDPIETPETQPQREPEPQREPKPAEAPEREPDKVPA